MKHDKSDIRLLLSILLLVSLSIGILYGAQQVPTQVATQQQSSSATQPSTATTAQPLAQQPMQPLAQQPQLQIIQVPMPPAEVKAQIPAYLHPFANLNPANAADQLEVFEQ